MPYRNSAHFPRNCGELRKNSRIVERNLEISSQSVSRLWDVYFASPVSTAGAFYLNNVAPGRYWILAQPDNDDTRTEMSKLRLPDAAKTRSLLRHAAEQRKTELELKPCHDVTFRLPLQ